MIRKDSFAVETESFASKRKTQLESTDERLRSHVREALSRVGLPSWQTPLVRQALAVFDEIARDEVEEWGPGLDEMRNEFERELTEALANTKKVEKEKFDAQVERITRWVSTMSINSATEAATTTDPDPMVGLEWVTMEDEAVRPAHKEAHGQQVRTGKPFKVGGVEMLYPGQPVGDPANWINCRCVARPAMLGDSLTASVPTTAEAPITSTVIVALPKADDPVSAISSEASGAHVTLLFLGESSEFDPAEIKAEVEAYASTFAGGPFAENVSGRATLGEGHANVVLLDATNLAVIRGAILASEAVRARHDQVEQFPTWIPHLTLGYPDAPATDEFTGTAIEFDRLAIWHGEERTEYPLAGKVEVVDESEKPEEFAVQEEAPVVEPPIDEGEPEWIPDDEAMIQVPFHGVAAPEGIPSGDLRQFGLGALINRPLPLPLKSMFIDDEGHKGSVISGRIDAIWREDNLIKYEGVFDVSEAAYETVRLIADGMWRGVSVDVDQATGAPMENGGVEYSEARISAMTVCAIPAFAEAFIALGTWADAVQEVEETPVATGENISADTASLLSGGTINFEVVPPKTKDGPGWITHPNPTKDITSYWVKGPGAAKISWGAPGDFNRCRTQLVKYVQNPDWLAGLCANLHYRALGTWPGRGAHAGGIVAMKMDEHAELPSVNLTASAALALTPVSADYFRQMDFTGPTPMTIEENGHVYGHLAKWDSCHIGFPEECTAPPRSETNYAYFLTGEYLTDSGRIPVGQITLGTGHATERMGMRAALAHYDNTGSAVADITVWEDEFGIAFSGKLREDLPEKDIRALMASPLSGDWRGIIVNGAKSMEMCAALAVNVQGFAVPRATYAMDGDFQLSLVAAGALEPKPVIPPEFDRLMNEYKAREERRIKLASLKAQGRSFRAEAIKAKIAKAKEK
jgi:2'-5' RNA ligase